MKTYTDEEKELMNHVLNKLNEYEFEKIANEMGKDFGTWLFEGDWFLDFCKDYRMGEKNGENNAGLELGFIINFDMWVNDSLIWPVYKEEWKK
jgi:hypothetical protein